MKNNIFPNTFIQAVLFLVLSLVLSAPAFILKIKFNISEAIFLNIYFVLLFFTSLLIYYYKNRTFPVFKYTVNKTIFYFIVLIISFQLAINAPLTFFLASIKGVSDNPLQTNFGVLFSIIILSPIVEEYIFRGIILHNFTFNYTKTKAILFSTIIFTLVHLSFVQFFGSFVFGILAGYIYYHTKSVGMTIILHFINNFIGMFAVQIHKQYGSSKMDSITCFYGDYSWLIISFSLIIFTAYYLLKNKKTIISQLSLADE